MLNGHNKKARAAVHVQFSGLEAKDEREQVLEAGRRIREAQQDATAVSPSPLLLLPPDRQQERQRMQQQGAQAVLLPNQIIKPLSEYLKDRYSNEARSNTLEEEEARQQEQQQQQNRTLHNAGRALSLQRGGTHERPAGTLEHPLPNEDPAVDTVMRLNIQAAELVRYLHGRYLYHAGKAGIKLEERMLEEQYEVLPDHVSRIFTEAYEPFEPCFLGSYCCAASRLQHPKVRHDWRSIEFRGFDARGRQIFFFKNN